MSKHIGRKHRWIQENSRKYSSPLGQVVYQQDGWYGILSYQTRAPQESASELPTWLAQSARLGPCKRPRNAMVAVEREATILRNRHGGNVLLNDQTWAGNRS